MTVSSEARAHSSSDNIEESQYDLRVPDTIFDRDGGPVQTTSSIWRVFNENEYLRINWTLFPVNHRTLRGAVRFYVARCIRHKSPSEASNLFQELCFFFRTVPAAILAKLERSATRESFQDSLLFAMTTTVAQIVNDGVEHRLTRVRAWYDYCAEHLAEYGFCPDYAFLLSGMRLMGNPKGENVHSLDPSEGPLSAREIAALVSALERDECDLTRSIQERAAMRLGLAFGRNPRNYCLLQENDLANELGFSHPQDEGWTLDIPRIKKRGQRRGKRPLKREYCSEPVVAALLQLIERNRGLKGLTEEDGRPLFMFTDDRLDLSASNESRISRNIRNWNWQGLLSSFVKRNLIISHRTGVLLRLSSRRLRYTFATTLAKQGVPRAELADMLDHSDLQSVGVYYAFGQDILREIDGAHDEYGRRIVRYFTKNIVKDKSSHPNASSPEMLIRIPDKQGNLSETGDCARGTKECGLDVPLACYSCGLFEPFADGEHYLALELADRRIALFGKRAVASELSVVREDILDVIEMCNKHGKQE